MNMGIVTYTLAYSPSYCIYSWKYSRIVLYSSSLARYVLPPEKLVFVSSNDFHSLKLKLATY